jgi:parallel beta-helix repeat protein
MSMKQRSVVACLSLLCACVVGFGGLTGSVAAAATPRATYYVDCTNGSDTNVGSTSAAAWKSLPRVSIANLQPGERVLLRRGCVFANQRIDGWWNGTAAEPILIGTYGSGEAPLIFNGKNQGLKITGSWLIFEKLRIIDIPEVTIACGQPIGTDHGVNLLAGSHDNVIRGLYVSGYQAGIRIAVGSDRNKILNNELTGNGMLDGFHADPSTDLGARGMVVSGDFNDIGYNTLRDNSAKCSNQGYKLQSNSIEVFKGRSNFIHHNRSYGDRVFSELGGIDGHEATSNTWAYNLMSSDKANSRFLVARGGLHSWGPTSHTLAMNNTVYLTGADSQAVSCGGGCDSSILSLHANILWAETRVVYADDAIDNANNVFWNSTGTPWIDIRVPTPSTSVVANPYFTNPARGNFRMWKISVARDRGALSGSSLSAASQPPTAAALNRDLAGTPVPQNGIRDIGAFEWVSN